MIQRIFFLRELTWSKLTCVFSTSTNASNLKDKASNNFSKNVDTVLKDEITAISEVETNLFGSNKKATKTVNELLKPYQTSLSPIKTNRVKEKKIGNKVTLQKGHEKSRLVTDDELSIVYTRLPLNDALLGKLILSAKSNKQRGKSAQIIVEGRRLILEAINCNCRLQTLIFSQKDQLALIKDVLGKITANQLIKVPHHDLKTWSTLTTTPGLLAIFERPDISKSAVMQKRAALPFTVICDNIREPNNLGSIIRSCAAVPCAQVIVLKGCCDPWESKALRSGCGGQFRVKIFDEIIWNKINDILPEEYSVFIAENNLKKVNDTNSCRITSYTDANISRNHNVIIIGGETHGISSQAYEFLQTNKNKGSFLHIPVAEGAESLNTASALTLILFELRRLLNQPQNQQCEISEHKSI